MANLTEILSSQPATAPDLEDLRNAPAALLVAGDGIVTAKGGTIAVTISTVPQQAAALELLKDVRSRIKVAQDRFKTIKDPMNAAKNAVLALEHEIVDPLEAFASAISKANSDFMLAQKRAAEAEARKLEQEQRDKQLAEARAESERLEKAGKIGQAVTVMVEAEKAPAPHVATAPIATAKVQGITSRMAYSAKVTDLKALVEHCLANPALLSMFVEPNMTALNGQARSLKEQLSIPGVELVTKYV